MTLMEISNSVLDIERRIADAPDDEAEQNAILDLLSCEGARDEKLDRYCIFLGELDARAKSRKEEADRLAHRAKVDAEKATWLRERLTGFFQTHELTTVETLHYRLTLAKNGGRPGVEFSVPEGELPAEFVRQVVTVKADRDAIREALEAGRDVPGASLKDKGYTMRIL